VVAVTRRDTSFAYYGDPADIAGKLIVDITPPKAPGRLCDFCGLRLGVGYTDFYAEPFARLDGAAGPLFPDGLLIAYDRRWAACRLCAPHVRRRAWAKLADLVCRRRRDAGRPVTSRRRAEMTALWLRLGSLLDQEEGPS
jgi:hypothetical protein